MRRIRTVSLIALALAGCATQAPPHQRGFEGGGFAGRRHGPTGASMGRPRRTFISPMGEPFRAHAPDDPAPDLIWFQTVDTDHDGRITLAEFRSDAARFFATLDIDEDGEIDPQELERYETEIAPEVRMGMGAGSDMGMRRGMGGGMRRGGGGGGMGRGGGDGGGGGMGRGGRGRGDFGGGGSEGGKPAGMPAVRRGAGRFGYFDLPEPVIAADTNLNRGVSAKEFDDAAIQRFGLLDTTHQGYLTRDTLPKLEREGGAHRRGVDRPPEKTSDDDSG